MKLIKFRKSICIITMVISLLFNNVAVFAISLQEESLKEVEVIDIGADHDIFMQEVKDDDNERVIITKYDEDILITTYFKKTNMLTQEMIEVTIENEELSIMSEKDEFKNIVNTISTDEILYNVIDSIETKLDNDSSEELTPRYLRKKRSAGSKYIYEEVSNTDKDYVVYLKVPDFTHTTRNMAGIKPAQSSARRFCDIFWSDINFMIDSADSMVTNIFGLIPGIGTINSIIDVLERYNNGSTGGAIGSAIVSILRASIGPADYFFSAAEISSYAAIYFGVRSTLKDTYQTIVRYSNQI